MSCQNHSVRQEPGGGEGIGVRGLDHAMESHARESLDLGEPAGVVMAVEPGDHVPMTAQGRKDRLADDRPVTLVLRPDIEDRNFHEVTKAFTGSEHRFPSAVTRREKGFIFHPSDGHALEMEAQQADFFIETQWQYMVHHPQEAQRGLKSHCLPAFAPV